MSTPAKPVKPALTTVAQATEAREQRRRAQVRAIKAAQRQLGLDDGTYRDMLAAQTRTPQHPGKRSATDLTVVEGARVLDWMRRQGAVNPRRPDTKRRPAPAPHRAGLMAKVHALLSELSRATGEVHGMAYADAIAKRNGWASCVDWCNDRNLTALVGALSRTVRSKGGSA